MKDPITLTEPARQAIERRLQSAPEGIIGLRLGIKSTGCSGNSYKMDYVTSGEDVSADDVFGRLYIAKTLSWMMFGMEIDYGVDDLGNERFLFKNPNEKGRCGCGESFQV